MGTAWKDIANSKTGVFLPSQQDVAQHRKTRKVAESKMCDQVHVKTMVLEKTKQAGVAEAGKESSEED